MSMPNRKKILSLREIQQLVNESDLSEDDSLDFSDSGGSEYLPSVCSPKAGSFSPSIHNICESSDNESNSSSSGEDDNPATQPLPVNIEWGPVSSTHKPRMVIPPAQTPIIAGDLTRGSSELDCFLKMFPKSLLIFIAQCTNQRLKKVQDYYKKKKTQNPDSKFRSHLSANQTDQHEILIVLGVMIIMCYNKVPSLYNYWSEELSLGNKAIKGAISRDRCTLLLSKMYYNHPEKPEGASKIYYIEEVASCLKKTFPGMRSESTFQAIDESMVKFKGRSSLKQYMPLKPIKRGIKVWERCDSSTGYLYDFNIYHGKEIRSQAAAQTTLGERVVTSLVSTLRTNDVVVCIDRFFTSAKLMSNLPIGCVGTYLVNRKNTPEFERTTMTRGEAQFQASNTGVFATKWRDTKDVFVMSNCHSNEVTQTKRKQKTGETCEYTCPEMIAFYNEKMGGVDLSDQKVAVYDFDRKSGKWWRKTFYRLLMSAAVNAWIVHNELTKKKPLISFLVPLAESMIKVGRNETKAKKRRSTDRGKTPKRQKMEDVGSHLPAKGSTRRRCVRCSEVNQKERRTKVYCPACFVPLCNDCFTPYHL